MSRFQDAFPGGDLPANLNTFFGYRLPTPAPADTNEDSVPGRLCWGQVGKLAEGELVTGDSFEVLDCDERQKEASRRTDNIRIENPDEPEDWVEVDRANTLVFHKTEKKQKAPTNSSASAPEGIDEYTLEQEVHDAFNPVDGSQTNRCKVTMNLSNGPTSA